MLATSARLEPTPTVTICTTRLSATIAHQASTVTRAPLSLQVTASQEPTVRVATSLTLQLASATALSMSMTLA